MRNFTLATLALAVLMPLARADETTPADRILVIDEGKSGKIGIQTDENMDFSVVLNEGGGVTVSPTEVLNKSKANFKVQSSDKSTGQYTISINVSDPEGAEGVFTTHDFTVWVAMSQKDADKGLKAATKAAEKSFSSEAKELESELADILDQMLDQAEIDLANAGTPADGSRTLAQIRAAILLSYILDALDYYAYYLAELIYYHGDWGTSAAAFAYSWLLSYSFPIVASLAFMASIDTAWGSFLAKMFSINNSTALKMQGSLSKYMSSLVKLAALYGLVMPYLMWFPDSVHPPCLRGPTAPALFASEFPEIPKDLTPKKAQKIMEQMQASGGGDGMPAAAPLGLVPQITGIAAWNHPNAEEGVKMGEGNGGTTHGAIAVAGLAPTDAEEDVTIRLTNLTSPTEGEFLEITVPWETLDTDMGAFAVVFGEPDTAGDAGFFGSLAPGLYEVALLQAGFAIYKFINLPYYSSQSLK